MAKLLTWNEMPQSIRDFDANISNNLDSCESKANELSVMVNEILVLLKDADTTLKEDFKEDPQCIDAEKKMFLIYSGFNVVKTSIDHDLISGIIGMGKEVKSTIADIRKKMAEGASWKEASEEEDSQGNKVTKDNDQAKIDAANIYINKMADCAVAEINAIKDAQAGVRLGISLETLKSGELGKYINFSTNFSKTSYLTNYEGISREFGTVGDPDDTVIKPNGVEEKESFFDKLKKLFKKIIEDGKKGAEDYFEFMTLENINSKFSDFKEWLSNLDITKTFPGLSGISDLYHKFTKKVSEVVNVPEDVQEYWDKTVQTVKENSFFEYVKGFWGGAVDKAKSIAPDVVEAVEKIGTDVEQEGVIQTGKNIAKGAVDKLNSLDEGVLGWLSPDSLDINTLIAFEDGAVQLTSADLLGVGDGSLLTTDNDLNDSLFNKE